MAYAKTVTVRKYSDSDFEILIDETDCGTTSEAEISDARLPRQFRIYRQTTVLASGSGSTIDPILGRITNPAGIDVLCENGTAAAAVDNVAVTPIPCYTADPDGKLYHRSRPDSGTNNVVHSAYLIRADWEG